MVGLGHDFDDVLPEGDEPYGKGLILQREIQYFRQARDNLVRLSSSSAHTKGRKMAHPLPIS